tara:strand:- start:76 stop:1284 length:1209 start_codon:yes stop_codon:yes gene_type:complete
MGYMLTGAWKFNQNIRVWSVSGTTTLTGHMFDYTGRDAPVDNNNGFAKDMSGYLGWNQSSGTFPADNFFNYPRSAADLEDLGIDNDYILALREGDAVGSVSTAGTATLSPEALAAMASAIATANGDDAKRKTRGACIRLLFQGTLATKLTMTTDQLGLETGFNNVVAIKEDTTIDVADLSGDQGFYVSLTIGGESTINVGDTTIVFTRGNNVGGVERYTVVATGGTLDVKREPAQHLDDNLDGYMVPLDKVEIAGKTFLIGSVALVENSGSICFLGSTKVQTDQGLIRFNKLTTNNTINGYKIKKVTKMINADDHMIFIEKDAISDGIPNKDTHISRNHGIIMCNHIVRAKTLVNGRTIEKAYRKPDIIYNVLTEPRTIMFVNNIPCETLNPNDPIVERIIK